MKWLRRWLAPARRNNRAVPFRPTFRPRVEPLEDRTVLNVSTVFDSAGNIVQFVVYQGGGLVRYDAAGGHVLVNSGVRVAHGFRDFAGNVGLDIVFSSGAAVEYDSNGGHVLAQSGVLDLSRAYDAFGNFKLDVVYTTASPPHGPDLTGTLIEYTNTGVTKLADNVRWATAYLDTNGGFGLAFGAIASSGNLVVFRYDTTVSIVLYNSPDGATQDLTDYSQAEDLNGHVWVDTTYGRFAGTYALESRPTGTILIGTGSDVQVGG